MNTRGVIGRQTWEWETEKLMGKISGVGNPCQTTATTFHGLIETNGGVHKDRGSPVVSFKRGDDASADRDSVAWRGAMNAKLHA